MPPSKREIYLLSPKKYSPEIIAVAFAKTSRSPETFRAIADELTEEASSQFHEKWVIGYGHSSVAEHAVLHLAIENASRLAMESIESNRLASYTEKSTRYQKWDKDQFYCPPEIFGSKFEERFNQICEYLFQTYLRSLEPAKKVVEAQVSRNEGESDENYDKRIRSKYVDACRFILPAASLANVGMTVNGRELESAIKKWLSSPLAEVREIGETVKVAAKAEVPTLLKYAEQQPSYQVMAEKITQLNASMELPEEKQQACTLVASENEGEDRILASVLYRFGNMSFEQALKKVKDTTISTEISEVLFQDLEKFDVPLRELEHSTMTFDLVMDQGAYAEFKRHRIMSQTTQRLTCTNGYAIPKLIVKAGFELDFQQAMGAAQLLWNELAEWNIDIAQYIVPNAFNRRVMATFNLREAFSFCQLRTAPNAHFSIRRIAQMMAVEVKRVYPVLSKYMRIYDEPWQQIELDHFESA